MPARRVSPASSVHSFTLFVEGLDVSSDAHIDALHEAGCDDATFGVRDGAAYALFDREAGSFSDALRSAMDDVLRALPHARIVRIEPDNLVTMATIAGRCGRTRADLVAAMNAAFDLRDHASRLQSGDRALVSAVLQIGP